MANGHLEGLLEAVATQMKADLDATAPLKHRGSKGTVREAGFRDRYLEKYLPGVVQAVGSGEAIAVDGSTSPQCDVMIVDRSTPPMWQHQDYRVVPIECLHGVIEVKSTLTTAELRKSWELLRSVKAMKKTAYGHDPIGRTITLYGKDWSHFPTLGVVFAYSSAELQTLGNTLAELASAESDPSLRIDAVFVLDRGYLAWQEPKGDTTSLRAGDEFDLAAFACQPKGVLMALTSALSLNFGDMYMPPLDLQQYLDDKDWGEDLATWSVSGGDGSRRWEA